MLLEIKQIVLQLLKAGVSAETISEQFPINISKVRAINDQYRKQQERKFADIFSETKRQE